MSKPEVVFRSSSPRSGRSDPLPVYKTMGYTLSISMRFLASHAVGRGTVARCDELLTWWWRNIFDAAGAELLVEGRDHFIRGAAHVVMSNHASLVDIPAMIGAVPGSVRMVTKEELFKVPVWGPALRASGFIPIDRKNRERAISQLEKAKDTLVNGVNVWIAPEGTRSRDGKLGPFKKGGFHTAMGLGAPIVPAWIDGAADALPPDQFTVHYGKSVRIRFGHPISTLNRSREDLEPLMREVREAILALSGRAQDVDGAVPAGTSSASTNDARR